jgi:hypothetical protein
MKKFIIIFLFLNSCVVNNTITNGNVKIISSNIRLDLGPGSKGVDYNNLGPSSKGITNLRFNINFPEDITKDLKIELIKNNQKKFDINLLEVNKENSFYISSPDMEKGLYKIKALTSNETKSINIEYYIEINSNKEIKFDIYNYKDKPELLDISIKSKNI